MGGFFMLNSEIEWSCMKVCSSIQELLGGGHPGQSLPRTRLLRLAALRELVLRAAGRFGYKVVNADKMHELYPDGVKGQVIYYSVNPDNAVVRRHLGAGGKAVFVRDGKVLVANGCRSRTISRTSSRKVLDTGLLEDALAAAAGLEVLGVQPEEVWRSKKVNLTRV